MSTAKSEAGTVLCLCAQHLPPFLRPWKESPFHSQAPFPPSLPSPLPYPCTFEIQPGLSPHPPPPRAMETQPDSSQELSCGAACSQPSPTALMAPQSGDWTAKAIRLGTKASRGPAPCQRLQVHPASFWVCRSPVSPPPAVPGLFCPLPGVPHRYSQMAAAARVLMTTWGGLQPE